MGEASDADGAPGLVVLMRGGMRACIEAPVVERAAAAPEHEVGDVKLYNGLRSEIARVVVAMALGAAQREARA
jgi:hypothetical protein